MKALEFLIWLRDEVGVIRHSKEGNLVDKPSNGELRRWLRDKVIRVNGVPLSADMSVEWDITDLVLFYKNDKKRCTIM
jgi:hypothetical protein